MFPGLLTPSSSSAPGAPCGKMKLCCPGGAQQPLLHHTASLGPSSSRSKLLGLGGGELPGSARAPCSLLSPLPQSPAKRRRSPSDGRMVVLRQFGLLLWKNYILQVGRHGAPGGTLPLALPDVVTSELSWRPGSCVSVSGQTGRDQHLSASVPIPSCPHFPITLASEIRQSSASLLVGMITPVPSCAAWLF